MSRRICLPVIALMIIALAYLVPGCDTLITEKTVIIEAGHPIADFRADPTLCCAPCTVQFTETLSRGPHQVWIWSFGDNKDSVDDSTPDPIHIYDTAGIFNVQLTILDTTVQDTGRDTEVKYYYITVGAASANFDAEPDTACPSQEITFWSPVSGGIYKWEWKFGDDSSITFTNTIPDSIAHLYDSVGTYWVILTVTDTCGSRTDSNQVIITDCPEVAFKATYPDDTIPLSEGCKPLTVAFHDESVPSEGDVMDTWHWNFGDGQTSELQDPTIEYTDTGTFVVTLSATSGGPEVTASDTIRVYDSTTAAFIAESPTTSCFWPNRQFQVKFKSESLGKIDTMIWHFGDGDTLYNNSNPVHAYDPGIYICSLEVYGICGIDTMADTFSMEDMGQSVILADVFDTVLFSITPPTGDTSITFTFTDESEGVVLSRQWVIDTVTVDNAPKQVSQTFSDTGWYYISLTIRNDCDTAEVTDSVYVSES